MNSDIDHLSYKELKEEHDILMSKGKEITPNNAKRLTAIKWALREIESTQLWRFL